MRSPVYARRAAALPQTLDGAVSRPGQSTPTEMRACQLSCGVNGVLYSIREFIAEDTHVKRERKLRIDFEKLRRTVPITAVLEKYGLLRELKQSGRQLKGPCPMHEGSKNSRSFVVNLDTHVWKCFSPSCDRGGGTLELVMQIENVDVQGAALLVARWFAIKSEIVSNHKARRRVP